MTEPPKRSPIVELEILPHACQERSRPVMVNLYYFGIGSVPSEFFPTDDFANAWRLSTILSRSQPLK